MFLPLFAPPGPAIGPLLVISVKGNAVAFTNHDGDADTLDSDAVFLGLLGDRHCWAVDADGALVASGPNAFADLMQAFGLVDEPTWVAAGRAVQLVEWARTHRYCGRCAAPTVESTGERARKCPRCGLLAFPRLAPAVITLVERDDGSALLARNARWPVAMYSCLAGFVEPGETLEDAVRREVREEVGVDVDGLRYRRSQPWPFPHSLMLGFTAQYAGGSIECEPSEIADARWFTPDDLPALPGPISIARWLIDDWLARTR